MSRNLMRMALIMASTVAYAQDDIFGYTQALDLTNQAAIFLLTSRSVR